MRELSQDATIGDYQQFIAELVKERGFDEETVNEVFTLLVEEIGELAKAIRKHLRVAQGGSMGGFCRGA